MNILLLILLVYLGLGILLATLRLVVEWVKFGGFLPDILMFLLAIIIWPKVIFHWMEGK